MSCQTMAELGTVLEFQNGRAFKKSEWSDTGLPIIRIQNLNDATKPYNLFNGEYDKRIEVQNGDLLFAWSASLGPHIWMEDTGVLNQHIFLVSTTDSINDRYAYYTLLNITSELEAKTHGAVFGHITKAKLLSHQIPLPPLPEQERIVAILDEAFAAIATATANAEKNLANARDLEKQALDLVVTGGLSREFNADTSVKKYLDEMEQTINGLVQSKRYRRPRLSADSEIKCPDFKIPKTWQWKNLHSLTVGISDGVHKKPAYTQEGIPFIAIENLTRGPGISFEPVRYISKSDHDEFIKRTNPERGDILITKDGTIGIVKLIETDIVFSLFVSVALVKPACKSLSEYLCLALKSGLIQSQIIPKGAALKHLYLRDLRQLWIPVPPPEEQDHIVTKFRPLNLHIENTYELAKQRLAHLTNLKQSLLHKAFTGELTADKKAADRTLSEAAV